MWQAHNKFWTEALAVESSKFEPQKIDQIQENGPFGTHDQYRYVHDGRGRSSATQWNLTYLDSVVQAIVMTAQAAVP